MVETSRNTRAKFGLIGFFLGVISLLAIFVQISALFEPDPKSTGQIIGELAADIKNSAKNALTGQATPETPEPAISTGRIVTILALCAAGGAIVLGGLGLYQNEPHRLPYMAVGFGVSAFMAQYVFWLAMLICGIALLISVLENLGSMFE
ncbi:hypothetical protein [Actibacterium pelagium]|uniref:Uncharacterized protein n=1 Tax=Actibacterium pelagium TaxID=2029103 RepID=A0A917EJB9_9RHOB|nr:hypothetical protein [Actibacterium pelagium]GGE43951.1 hypothetical protein GCM10011517_09530 [Actibacterium pelagium]